MKKKLPKGTRLAIRQVLGKTHSASERKNILSRTQTLYDAFIWEAPAPGGMNFLRSQYYGGLSVFAFYEAMDRKVKTDVLQEILWRMLLGGGDIRKRKPSGFHSAGPGCKGWLMQPCSDTPPSPTNGWTADSGKTPGNSWSTRKNIKTESVCR